MNLFGGIVAEHERKERLMREIGAQLATLPSTDAEKRLERLVGALVDVCDKQEEWNRFIWCRETQVNILLKNIRDTIKNNA